MPRSARQRHRKQARISGVQWSETFALGGPRVYRATWYEDGDLKERYFHDPKEADRFGLRLYRKQQRQERSISRTGARP